MQHLLPLLHFCHCTDNYSLWQGRNHGWKVEGGGAMVWVPTPRHRRPAPGQRPGWVLGAEEGRPLPLWGSGGITPGNFLENSDAKSCILVTRPTMLINAPPRTWNFLLFESYVQQVGGPIYIVRPQPKSWGDQSPPVPMVIAPMACGWHCFQVFCDCEHYSVPQK